ncbi:hypothetical protein [Pseudotabrizicola algicola]|uniref:Uncharacterized protein n=1 Tax=Pseudotabrizicola algicola TaxID=2709381 RepID=A0A6B3RRH6_9RHOB|nr:hypothetical protein [Pseudotabrizicola algicola]NEX47746.1 hypothetical protein [Pseudotabrizicola algicola]
MSKIDFSRIITRSAREAEDECRRLQAELVQAEADLAATDWQVIREAEGGPAMDPALRAARAEARANISRLREAILALTAVDPA